MQKRTHAMSTVLDLLVKAISQEAAPPGVELKKFSVLGPILPSAALVLLHRLQQSWLASVLSATA